MTLAAPLGSIAPLLAAITFAEEISRDVAARQSLLAPPRLRQTLRRQSWQEAAHAAVFRSALRCIPGSFECPPAVRKALQDYAARIHADLDRGGLAVSMVGLHCVLEGFAAIALQVPPGALASVADQLVPLRSFILHQEQAHQRLGGRWAPRLLADPHALGRSAREYCALAESLLTAGLGHLECLHENADHYRREVGEYLHSAVLQLERSDPFRPTAAAADSTVTPASHRQPSP